MYPRRLCEYRRGRRRGLTLVELLLASAILAMLAGGVAALAVVVQTSSDFHFSRGLTLQHGRVAIERLERTLSAAHANDQFPGFVVFTDLASSVSFPDTLVAWVPEGAAARPRGLPRFRELVVFTIDPAIPRQLLEIRVPSDSRFVPSLDDAASWRLELSAIKRRADAHRVILTDLVRVVSPAGGLGPRGAVRFEVTQRPSAAQWQAYRDGLRTWESLPWPQDIYGVNNGLGQLWCRIELQLRPGNTPDDSSEAAVPMFGSATLYYQLRR